MSADGSAVAAPRRVSLPLLTLLFISITLISGFFLQPFDVGGDVAAKWRFVRYLVDPAWSLIWLDHQTARWALNLPAALLAAIFGVQASAVYLVPTLAFAALSCLLLVTWRRLLGWPVTLLLMGAVAINPMNVWLHSEFMPDNVSIIYIWAAFALLTMDRREGYAWSALVLFLAYGAKITNIFFLPGILVWLWFSKSPRTAIIYGAILLGLFVLECIAASVILGRFLPLGLVQASLSTHLAGMETTYVYGGWIETILRWKLAMGALIYAKAIMLAFVGCAITTGIVRLWRPIGMPAPISLALSMGISFTLFISFAATSIDPFRPVEPLIDRYLWPLFPFALTYLGWVLQRIATKWLVRLEGLIVTDTAWTLATSACFCVALALSSAAYLQYKRIAHRNGIAYPFNWYSIDDYFERMKSGVNRCAPAIFYHPKTVSALDTILTPVGGPLWSNTISVNWMPRRQFLSHFAPHLVGTTDEHEGTPEKVYIVVAKHCARPTLCAGRIYGALEYDEPVSCRP